MPRPSIAPPRPRTQRAASRIDRRLLIAVVVINALLALLSGVLVAQDLARPRAAKTAPVRELRSPPAPKPPAR